MEFITDANFYGEVGIVTKRTAEQTPASIQFSSSVDLTKLAVLEVVSKPPEPTLGEDMIRSMVPMSPVQSQETVDQIGSVSTEIAEPESDKKNDSDL